MAPVTGTSCIAPRQGKCQPGVYAIVNKANGKMYIGSTRRSLAVRLATHRRDLRKGIHHNRHLQRAWNKYGERAFDFVVLEQCPAALCYEQEEKWIEEKMTRDAKFGYNKAAVVDTKLGQLPTEEAMARRRAKRWKNLLRPDPRRNRAARLFADWLEDNSRPKEAKELRRAIRECEDLK